MGSLSDEIEEYLKNMVRSSNGILVVQRNSLAKRFRCVPSQISYVLDTRFVMERGYLIESRRGGGGYVRIVKLNLGSATALLDLVGQVQGPGISEEVATHILARLQEERFITPREADLLRASISRSVLGNSQEADHVRKRLLTSAVQTLVRWV
jgi:transcriptional regulator CtsR